MTVTMPVLFNAIECPLHGSAVLVLNPRSIPDPSRSVATK